MFWKWTSQWDHLNLWQRFWACRIYTEWSRHGRCLFADYVQKCIQSAGGGGEQREALRVGQPRSFSLMCECLFQNYLFLSSMHKWSVVRHNMYQSCEVELWFFACYQLTAHLASVALTVASRFKPILFFPLIPWVHALMWLKDSCLKKTGHFPGRMSLGVNKLVLVKQLLLVNLQLITL